VFGFATAYNLYAPRPSERSAEGRDVLHVDIYAQRAFLDEYCGQHPTEVFVSAVVAMIRHLDK
jgi:hypothetical protein